MTQDEIIEMAMQAEFVSRARSTDEESELFVCVDKDIVRFAALVAAKEREACAKVADQISDKYVYGYYGYVDIADEIAAAIRARGEQA